MTAHDEATKNGQKAYGSSPEIMAHAIAVLQDDQEFSEELINELRRLDAPPYFQTTLLYTPDILTRCALLLHRSPTLFHGETYQAVEYVLRAQVNKWSREVERRVAQTK